MVSASVGLSPTTVIGGNTAAEIQMNQPLVKGGQGRCARGLTLHAAISAIAISCVILLLSGYGVWLLMGWWPLAIAVPDAAVAVLALVINACIKRDLKRMTAALKEARDDG